MRKTIRTVTLTSLLALIGFCANLYAQDNRNRECKPNARVVVFFGNGLDTIEDKAFDGSEAIKRAIKKDVQDGKLVLPPNVQLNSICYRIAYNTDEFSKFDLVESYVQALGSGTTDLWLATTRLIPMPKFLEDSFVTIALGLNDANYVISQDLQDHVKLYQGEIAQNRKVIVVPHSQGNFYANAAYRTIFGFDITNKLTIVSVAEPDSFIAGDPTNNNYTTFYADFIVAVPGALAGNTDGDGAKCDTSPYDCHGFANSYLVGTYSRERILGQIVNAIPTDEQPPSDFTLNVDGQSNIWGSGQGVIGFGGGLNPPGVVFPAVSGQDLIFSSVTGSTHFGCGNCFGGPDGGISPISTVFPQGKISGITLKSSLPLLAVFLGPELPAATPPSLDFNQIGYNFSDLAPELGQIFFVGDGLTDTGTTQRFHIPNGATRLFLGFVDLPGNFGDNGGSLNASFSVQ